MASQRIEYLIVEIIGNIFIYLYVYSSIILYFMYTHFTYIRDMLRFGEINLICDYAQSNQMPLTDQITKIAP